MAIRNLARLIVVCIFLAGSVSLAESLECRNLNRREYVVTFDITKGGLADQVFITGKDMYSGTWINLKETKRSPSTGRPVKLIFNVGWNEMYPDWTVEYDIIKKSVVVFEKGRSGKRKIGAGRCLNRKEQEDANESAVDAQRMKDVITTQLKRALVDRDSTKAITVTLLINTYMKATQNEDDLSFNYLGPVEEPKLEDRPKYLKKFGLLVDTDATDYFMGGYNSFRVTGTARQISTAILKYKYGGQVVWAGFGNANKAAARGVGGQCKEYLRAAESW